MGVGGQSCVKITQCLGPEGVVEKVGVFSLALRADELEGASGINMVEDPWFF